MKATLSLSLTETPQFRRLVGFVSEVETYAETSEDFWLAHLVDELRMDLLEGST